MIIKNANEEEIKQAIYYINQKYFNGNVAQPYLAKEGKGFRLTLSVKDTHGKGARLSQSYTKKGNRRHLINACWHVHGHFFDALLEIQPKAIIKTAKMNIYKDVNGQTVNNWQDWNIGSMIEPLVYSEACECNTFKYAKLDLKNGALEKTQVKQIHQNRMSSECWIVQIKGLEECKECELKDSDECGGANIRKTGKNSLGLSVPIG